MNKLSDSNLDRFGRYAYNGGQLLVGTGWANPAQSCGATNGTAIVGSYPPNDWGLYDTVGNVWELCLDWSEDDISAYGGRPNIDPSAPANTLAGAAGQFRRQRGGSWGYGADYARSAHRGSAWPDSRGRVSGAGFRVLCLAGLQ